MQPKTQVQPLMGMTIWMHKQVPDSQHQKPSQKLPYQSWLRGKFPHATSHIAVADKIHNKPGKLGLTEHTK
jgi:hypothetical protein